ncbi:MAG: hypothetical protein C4519_07815 [Desulfobacteraceae bacterium]|nr:MAG: hypothetical protein C4519_07815 [Desulfobacteraceae bacterium]
MEVMQMISKTKRTGVYRVLPQAAVLCALIFASSCATTNQIPQPSSVDRIMAENSQMKKRMPMIERENDVLTQENHQYKAKLQKARDKNEKLSDDLSALTEKFEAYLSSTQEQITSMQAAYVWLENASSQKIAELTTLYDALELKRLHEVNDLELQIAEQKNDFGRETDNLRRKAAEKELELSTQIKELNQSLVALEAEKSSLQTSNSELSVKLEALSNQLAQTRSERNRIEKDLQTVRAVNAELLERLKNPGIGMLNTHLR